MSKIHPLQFTGPSILVIGDIMLDEYIYTENSKVSPEAPVIATRVSRREYRAGGSANVALNISKLGIKCEVLATIGDDDAGKNLERIFKENNVILLQLDWTKKDLNIKNFLISKDRYGIPYNEIYNFKFKEGLLLPELLNKKQLINILNQ